MLTESPTEAQAAKAQVIKIQVFCLINQVQAVAPTVSCHVHERVRRHKKNITDMLYGSQQFKRLRGIVRHYSIVRTSTLRHFQYTMADSPHLVSLAAHPYNALPVAMSPTTIQNMLVIIIEEGHSSSEITIISGASRHGTDGCD
jgi:hypothetical protein